jgi:hypothetical protein
LEDAIDEFIVVSKTARGRRTRRRRSLRQAPSKPDLGPQNAKIEFEDWFEPGWPARAGLSQGH